VLLGTAAPGVAIEGGWEVDHPIQRTDMAQIWVGNGDGRNDRFRCSGTVTSKNKILTAEHCFDDISTKDVFVLTPTTQLGQGSTQSSVTRKVSRGDLAVLTVSWKKLNLWGAKPAMLGPNRAPWVKDLLSSYGWGKTCYYCGPAPWLKGVQTKVIDNGPLRDDRGGHAYRVRAIKGRIRKGDSGGPNGYLIGEQRIVTGVMSTARPDGPANATMSATYDKKGCNPDKTCVYDWLRDEAGMKVYNPGHDPDGDLKKRSLRVMPLGDSITAGVQSSDNNGYRDELYNALEDAAREGHVNFVGSVRRGTMSDRDNEGHPGERIDQIAGYAECSVPRYQPNVITLHAGTNDFDQTYKLSTAPRRMKALIEQVLADSPKAVVVVAKVIPTAKPGMQPRIDAFNAKLPGIVSDLRADGKHVVLTDTSDVKVGDGLQDDSHPNDTGYAKLGYDFNEGVMEAADKGWIKKPDPQKPATGCKPGPGDDASKAGPGWRALGAIAPGMTYPSGRTDLADFDGDGRDDYVRIDEKNHTLRIALNLKSKKPGFPHWKEVRTDVSDNLGLIWDKGWKLHFADVDGDGLDDIVVAPPSGTKEAVRNILNQGLTSSGSEVLWSGPGPINLTLDHVEQEAVRFADVNGDGRDDYLRVGKDGSVHAYYNLKSDTGGWEWKEHRNWAPGVFYGSRSRLRLADVNGDGKADYLMVGKRGAVHAYINNGGRGHGGFTEHRYFVRETGYPGDKSTFRDISGDGKADYVVVYDGGSVRAWLNRGGNM
jgi:lysophospholipase L1-like esterase